MPAIVACVRIRIAMRDWRSLISHRRRETTATTERISNRRPGGSLQLETEDFRSDKPNGLQSVAFGSHVRVHCPSIIGGTRPLVSELNGHYRMKRFTRRLRQEQSLLRPLRASPDIH